MWVVGCGMRDAEDKKRLRSQRLLEIQATGGMRLPDCFTMRVEKAGIIAWYSLTERKIKAVDLQQQAHASWSDCMLWRAPS